MTISVRNGAIRVQRTKDFRIAINGLLTRRSILHSRKLDFVDLLAAICLFVTGSKGMSAIQFSRTMVVQYKTAWVLCHKLRECLADETDDVTLSGEVEIDGAYFGGHIRPANEKANRIDRASRSIKQAHAAL